MQTPLILSLVLGLALAASTSQRRHQSSTRYTHDDANTYDHDAVIQELEQEHIDELRELDEEIARGGRVEGKSTKAAIMKIMMRRLKENMQKENKEKKVNNARFMSEEEFLTKSLRDSGVEKRLSHDVDGKQNWWIGGDDCASYDYGQPHIVFMLADDVGFNDIGWNDETVDTPYMNDLAANGIILDRNYVGPACSPTRGSLMTGKATHKIGMQHNVIYPDFAECLDLNQRTIGEEMRDIGYTTHYIGKWHLGFCNTACLPTSRGFDTFFGFQNAMTDYYTYKAFGAYDWWDNGEVYYGDSSVYAAEAITQRAVDLIHAQDPNKPMFLFVSQALAHTPFQLPAHVTPAATRHGMIKQMVHELDNSVKGIMEAMKDSGLYDNSVFIFSSDNGGQKDCSSNEPLRGSKSTLWEGGVRVPGMVHSPLQYRTGIKSEEIMYVSDWYRTLVSLGGGCVYHETDSLDQTELIMWGEASARDEFFYNVDDVIPQPFGMASMFYQGYKLIVGFPGTTDGYQGGLGHTHELDLAGIHMSRQQRRPNATRAADPFAMDWEAVSDYCWDMYDHMYLFNVMDDPSETTNLIDEYWDVHDSVPSHVINYMLERLLDELYTLEPVHIYHSIPEANPWQNYGGVWTPGWC